MLLFQLVIGGIAQGCVYGLVAMGIVLIYQARQTISLAQGEFMLLGAWLTLVGTTTGGLPYWLAASAAVVGVSAMAWLMQHLLMHRLMGRPVWLLALLTGAAAYGARRLIVALSGTALPTTTLPAPYREDVWMLAGVPLHTESLAAITVTALVCAGLLMLVRFNKVGFALHAAMRNRSAARHMGLPVRYLDAAVWVLAALLATAAGLLQATWAPVDGDMAWVGLKALPAAWIGGVAHLRGAMLGGIFIGVVEAIASAVLPEPWQDLPAYALALLWWPIARQRRLT